MVAMTRPLPAWVAPVVEQLELSQPTVVSTSQLDAIAESAGLAASGSRIVQALEERGWLQTTGVHGVWEFIPGSHAGRFGHADPFLTLRAVQLVQPEIELSVALGSALWLLDLRDRPPLRHEVAVPRMSDVPPGALRSLRAVFEVTSFAARLERVKVRGLDVHRPESILVQLAESPTAAPAWGALLEVLPDLAERCEVPALYTELEGRSHATLARLSYLLHPHRSDLVEMLSVKPRGVVWFGPRGKVVRSDSRWNVVDTLLPRPPGS